MEEKIKRPLEIINGVLNHQELSLQVLDALELYSRRVASLIESKIPNIGILVFNRAYGDFDFLYSAIREVNNNEEEKIVIDDKLIENLASSLIKYQFGEKKITKELEKEKKNVENIISDFFKLHK
mgnify:CR=1 FL=1